MKRLLILIFISIYTVGCSWVVDLPRSLWGSSTRVLSHKRADAETAEFSCSLDLCFDAVLELTVPYVAKVDEEKGREDGRFVLFAKDSRKRYVILMGVPASVDTTEVGVFFDRIADDRTKIDISSLSSRAKKKAAEIIFAQLSTRFDAGE